MTVEGTKSGAPERPPGSARVPAAQAVAGEGGVGGDDAGDAAVDRGLDDVGELVVGRGRGRSSGRSGAGRARRALAAMTPERSAARAARPWSSRSRSVFGEETLTVAKSTKGPACVSTSAKSAARSALSLLAPRLRPTIAAGRAGGEAGGDGRGAVVVEAEAVDDRAVLRAGGRGGARVAGLRARGGGADLDEAEAGAAEGGDGAGVLVEAGGEAERVRQVEAGEAGGEPRAGQRAGAGAEAGGERGEARPCAVSGSMRRSSGRREVGQAHGGPSASGPRPEDVGAGERTVEVREEGAAAGGLPAQRRAGGAGVDGERARARSRRRSGARACRGAARPSRNG